MRYTAFMHTNLIIAVWLFCVGTAFGSFINVLVDRGHRHESLLGRSHCENCGHTLSWYELIPLLSYVFLGGKCFKCKSVIPIRLFFVEFLTGIVVTLPFLLLRPEVAWVSSVF